MPPRPNRNNIFSFPFGNEIVQTLRFILRHHVTFGAAFGTPGKKSAVRMQTVQWSHDKCLRGRRGQMRQPWRRVTLLPHFLYSRKMLHHTLLGRAINVSCHRSGVQWTAYFFFIDRFDCLLWFTQRAPKYELDLGSSIVSSHWRDGNERDALRRIRIEREMEIINSILKHIFLPHEREKIWIYNCMHIDIF